MPIVCSLGTNCSLANSDKVSLSCRIWWPMCHHESCVGLPQVTFSVLARARSSTLSSLVKKQLPTGARAWPNSKPTSQKMWVDFQFVFISSLFLPLFYSYSYRSFLIFITLFLTFCGWGLEPVSVLSTAIILHNRGAIFFPRFLSLSNLSCFCSVHVNCFTSNCVIESH